ncbi:MAG: RdgB/HAM1 family non-canonical purine NTP pyrophosphatase [Thermotogae bacterium]|nr:RdgB/HAM1 family non-canonical purine NTP pyrophosphatase [Thermotogota bacterium]
MTILIATTNPHKLEEIKAIAPACMKLIALFQFDEVPHVEESGDSFLENSIIKAVSYGRFFDLPTIADDSGLVVDALGGKPGVESARFMSGRPYETRMRKILEQLSNTEKRDAAFHCVASFYDPATSVLLSFEGIVKGRIAKQICGSSGFGYDPIFIPVHRDKTFGELSQKVKNAISHRARAFRGLFHLLTSVFPSKVLKPFEDHTR